jgi:toxin ParE1/3/4
MAEALAWVPAAVEELAEIESFISRDSVAAAVAVVSRFIEVAEDLKSFPLMGPVVVEWNDESFRQRIVYSYRLIYHVGPGQVTIAAIWHGARLLPTSIRRRIPRR